MNDIDDVSDIDDSSGSSGSSGRSGSSGSSGTGELPDFLANRWIDPVDNGIVTSYCGARSNPVLDVEEYHNGIDIAADEGANVYAVRTGTVTDVHVSETYGNVMEFETDDGYRIVYNHLKKIFVEEGEKIVQGEVVAQAGSTGLVTGPHLHYTVYLGSMLMDPIQFTSYT